MVSESRRYASGSGWALQRGKDRREWDIEGSGMLSACWWLSG